MQGSVIPDDMPDVQQQQQQQPSRDGEIVQHSVVQNAPDTQSNSTLPLNMLASPGTVRTIQQILGGASSMFSSSLNAFADVMIASPLATRPVWSAVQLHACRLLEPNFPLLTSGQMLARFPLRLLFGFTAMRPSSSNRLQQCKLAPIVAACVHRALLERRQHNRTHPYSLRADPRLTVARAHKLLRLNARATFAAAQREEDRIYTDYDTWQPARPPTQVWVDCWSRLFPAAPAHCLRGLPYLALPSFDNSEGDSPPPPPPAGGGV